MHALTGIALALSLVVASVAEAYHSHEDETESAAECSVCQLAQTPGHATGSYTPGLTGEDHAEEVEGVILVLSGQTIASCDGHDGQWTGEL